MTDLRSLPVVTLFGLALLAAAARGDGLEVPRDGFEFGAEITGRGEPMDYGPFLSYSVFLAGRIPATRPKEVDRINLGLRTDKPPLVLKGITVRLGEKAACVFDTDMCSVPAAWTGGFLDIGRTNLNGTKGGDLAYLRLPAIFQNAQTPGWSDAGDFKDPRPSPYGRLPNEVAHYRGLYLHGDTVVFSYTVGSCGVLETPTMLTHKTGQVFCRTVRMEPSDAARNLFVCELPDAAVSADLRRATLGRKDTTIRVGVKGGPDGTRLNAINAGVFVSVPAHKSPTTFQVFVARDLDASAFDEAIASAPPAADLRDLCKPGPAHWKKEFTLSGKLGGGDAAYVVDDIPLPEDNPWQSWMRPAAFDFFPDGRVALSTWNGDVWIVSGLDDKLDRVVWRRFATGLFDCLGLKVVDGTIYVLGRDQITKLHDLDGDGEADFYENFNNDAPAAPSFHGFALDLQTDSRGNFYFHLGAHRVQEGTPLHGGVLKVSKDGSKIEMLGSGLREAAGMAVGPDDLITVADNQGNWVPSSKIDVLKPDGFYGYQWGTKPPLPTPEPPLCWIPLKEDNSSGGQVWVDSDRWGPFKGCLLHTSYGTCKLFRVFVQRDGERFQGGVMPFPLTFETGVFRPRFSPKDGQLYLCGLKGWGTDAKKDGGFYRVRYTGKPVQTPTELRVRKGAVDVTFTTPLDRKTVVPEALDVRQWNYRYSKEYGSKDYSVSDPQTVGRDRVTPSRVTLSEDGKTVTLEMPGLRPVNQMMIVFRGLKAADGAPADATICNTINYIPE